MNKYHYISAYKDESRLFYFALSAFFVVFLSYMYFLSSSVMNVVMRMEVDREIATLGTNVGRLEAEYIEMQHSVSSDIATLQGYVVLDKKVFIDKAEDTLVLLQN